MSKHAQPDETFKPAQDSAKATGVAEAGVAFHGLSEFSLLYRNGRDRHVRTIRTGVPATYIKDLGGRLKLQQKELLNALNISQATMSRKAASDVALSSSDSERVLGVAKLIGQVETMMAESSDVRDFDAAEWVGRWLTRPARALGGVKPIDYLDTIEGQGLLSDLLAKQQSGAYA